MSTAPPRKHKNQSEEKVKLFKARKKKVYVENAEIKTLQEKYDHIDGSAVKTFNDFPLSRNTQRGLKDSGYNEPTEIQKESIGLALRGMDILGAAKTGSGKTLAFLIPALEILFCQRWSRLDGLGIMVITPTRELAYQIFETMRKVGRYHDFSAGLVIGGKDLKFETKRMDQCNIVIGTPGRILQHMNENPLFDCINLQLLVLDEADRCLDMGFEATMNGIIENLPPKRQTLLFSATQTKSVRDLARLSLKDPIYVSVHEHSRHSTPENLQQSYMVCELHQKMDLLWSFLRNHRKHKILIFMSSCKQVKYIYEMFCRLRPGISLMALYGTLHQLRRMAIYEEFCKKQHAVLFATDIASRGLDFPAVNWVVQLDCPENAQTYIHRVGRTARYKENGESLLVLVPSEEPAMVEQLVKHKIPISKIKVNPKKLQSPQRKMEAQLARDPGLKETAQRAFVSYAKSVFLMKNKEVFNVFALDTDSYARSLGLALPPRIRFLKKYQKQSEEKLDQGMSIDAKESTDEREDVDKLFASSEDDVETEYDAKTRKDREVYDFGSVDSGSEEDLLQVKRKNHGLEMDGEDNLDTLSESDEMPVPDEGGKKPKKVLTKAAIAKRLLKKKIVVNKKVVFDEEGLAQPMKGRDKMSQQARAYEAENEGGIDFEKAKSALREEDRFDKQLFRDRLKAKRREKKLKTKKAQEKLKEEEEVGSESDEGPNLDWLPDPDAVYGDESDNEERSSLVKKRSKYEDGDELYPPSKKTKTSLDKKHRKAQHQREKSALETDEALALRLLSGR